MAVSILTTPAIAGDADDVKSAVLKMNAAWNAGDIETISEHNADGSLFNFTGLLLVNTEFDKERTKSQFEEGLKYDRTWKHLEVTVYGNSAVVTGYHVGRATLPDGTYRDGTRRVSEFWTKMGGKWKLVHRHASQLEPSKRKDTTQ